MDGSELSGILNQSSIVQMHNETNSTMGQVRANMSNLQILSNRIEQQPSVTSNFSLYDMLNEHGPLSQSP